MRFSAVDEDAAVIQERAAAEFDAAVETLRLKGVNVFVIEDTPLPAKPDAVFPNNWVSFHEDGTVILYPMFRPAGHERRREIIEGLASAFEIGEVVDLSGHEAAGRYLEGTGSMVLDHANGIAYASLSPRTDEGLLHDVCERLHLKPVTFRSHDRGGREIYHTNVMMCVAEKFAVVCLDSITDEHERDQVTASLRDSGYEIVDITLEQMMEFAGNMLALRTNDGRDILALSQTAFASLSAGQIATLEQYCELVPIAIDTIEAAGGGSVRCMIAEIFLKPRF